MSEYTHVWTWSWRTLTYPGITARVPWFGDGVDRTGMRCRVVVRGGMNSALIEFEDGARVVTSRGGIRRAKGATEIASNTDRS
jgi:hypothetical protein